MDELAIRFHKNNQKDTIFVSWVKDIGEMCEIDFASTRQHRGNGIDYVYKRGMSAPKATTPVAEASTTSQPSRTASLRPFAKRAIKSVARRSRLDRSKAYQKAIRAGRSLEARNYKTYTPSSDDKIFIAWGEWWDQTWLNKMKSYANSGAKLYPVCHDILPMVVPQFSGNSDSLASFVTQLFPISTAVLTISKSTKRDLTKWMTQHKLTAPTIELFSLGEDFEFSKTTVSDSHMVSKYGITKDEYLMYVSTIEARKNHTLLYYVYKLAHSRNIKLPKLLIIGRVGHDTSEIIKFIKEDSDVNQLLQICDFVNDNELNWLYENCKFTVMPSFYEGWGLPVVESIARGKSAICSNTSSLNEISDDYVIRFNPASTDECLHAITAMAEPQTLERYRANTKKYKLHSWDGAYSQILGILKET